MFNFNYFLAQNLSSFIALPWKLHNRYCHTKDYQAKHLFSQLEAGRPPSLRTGDTVSKLDTFYFTKFNYLNVICLIKNLKKSSVLTNIFFQFIFRISQAPERKLVVIGKKCWLFQGIFFHRLKSRGLNVSRKFWCLKFSKNTTKLFERFLP